MKKIILFLIMSVFLFGFSLEKKITFNGYISKVTFDKKYLVTALENGDIFIKNFNTLKNIYTIKLPKIHDFMDDEIPMPIYSLDIEKNKILILAGGEDSKREVYIFDISSKKLNHIIDTKDTYMKAKFVNGDILFGYLSDEISLYSLKNKKNIYKIQAGNYVFSTYKLNENKKLVAVGDESGVVKILNVKNGKKIAYLSGFNKEQTLSLDFKNGYILNASSDKRVAVYNLKTKSALLEFMVKFLPYGATLSPKADKLAVQYDEKNDIIVYDKYQRKLALLKGHTMALNGITFINKNKILSFSPAEILIWKLKEK